MNRIPRQKVTKLNSKFSLTLGQLNRALNNPAQIHPENLDQVHASLIPRACSSTNFLKSGKEPGNEAEVHATFNVLSYPKYRRPLGVIWLKAGKQESHQGVGSITSPCSGKEPRHERAAEIEPNQGEEVLQYSLYYSWIIFRTQEQFGSHGL